MWKKRCPAIPQRTAKKIIIIIIITNFAVFIAFHVCFTMRHWLLHVYFVKLYLIVFFNGCFTVLRSLFNDFVLRGLWKKGRGHVYRTFIKSCSKYIKQLTPLTLTYIKTLAVDKKSLEVALFFFILLLTKMDWWKTYIMCWIMCLCDPQLHWSKEI